MSASLFDFGLYFFHNARELLTRHSGPYFYLPKLENHKEARLWNEVFNFAQDLFNLDRGTIKVTVLIETITAAFEMDEILYELSDHIVGLNCGRWDYIFSFIKRFRNQPEFCLPDRAVVGMTTHFLRSYSQLLIKTCHRRGAYAIGGMAAQIPIKDDAVANEAALAKVREDKLREVGDGHDGTWVAHPGLIPVAMEVISMNICRHSNQLERFVRMSPSPPRTCCVCHTERSRKQGLRNNIVVTLHYLEAWLSGQGCVPIHHLMEDAATAEICACADLAMVAPCPKESWKTDATSPWIWCGARSWRSSNHSLTNWHHSTMSKAHYAFAARVT